ncbi:hypothetical protein LZK98_04885 [Sphingomonas cannabina]|uniref:hypothetical protein n=1 Tax=Sphingomonas cannabina TaxID=2899123 RepID=UPI001F354157|nr:hypothetical protein [Sphingomonas cannabina]UIJ46284.1 hypothetical protein LZK98_04885 [Sphingomonas cannabina]
MRAGRPIIAFGIGLLPLVLCSVSGGCASVAASSDLAADSTTPRELRNGNMVSEIRVRNHGDFTLVYDRRDRTIELRHEDHATSILRIPTGYDPALVGAEGDIRFLPARLQPYIAQGKLLLTLTLRTTGGDGNGQCGAGVEEYLKVVDVSSTRPQVIASHLIGSCAEAIELDHDGGREDMLLPFRVTRSELQIRLLSYRNRDGGPFVAHLSPDFRRLQLE